MPCPGRHFDDDASIHPIPLNDLLELHPFKAKYYSPHCKPALVAFVIDAAQEQRSLRALGSMYSLSQAHVAEGVITTSFLHRHLSQPFPSARGTLPESRLARQSDGLVLSRICAASADQLRGRHFIFVESGIPIRQLLTDLKRCGLAPPTMGAGGGKL